MGESTIQTSEGLDKTHRWRFRSFELGHPSFSALRCVSSRFSAFKLHSLYSASLPSISGPPSQTEWQLLLSWVSSLQRKEHKASWYPQGDMTIPTINIFSYIFLFLIVSLPPERRHGNRKEKKYGEQWTRENQRRTIKREKGYGGRRKEGGLKTQSLGRIRVEVCVGFFQGNKGWQETLFLM